MSRQLDLAHEVRQQARNDALVRAIEYGLIGALQNMGMELRGIAIKYQEFSVLMTIKVDTEGKWFVAHVHSDSIRNCFLRADREAARNELRWVKDKYQPKGV